MKQYCYKVKWDFLKIKENNAYAHAKIENFGFEPIFQEFDEGPASWVGGWAKRIEIAYETKIGQWLIKNIEGIYKAEKDKEDSKWVKELLETGYEFDEEGHLIINDLIKKPTLAELCIMKEGSYHGTLFINIGGAMEIYDKDILLEACPDVINELMENKVVYVKRLREEE